MNHPRPRTVAVTGAAGFLGNALCRELLNRGYHVRVLLLPEDKAPALVGLAVERVRGDVTRSESLDELLTGLGPQDALIHAASQISLAWNVFPEIHGVNVGGTAEVIAAARRHSIGRLIYVSSVHALPEPALGVTAREISDFDPATVVGGYAQTKAEATALVLAAGRAGLDVVVVHPTGLLGPGDPGPGAQTTMVRDVAAGRLNIAVAGGHDYADVRDVAAGIATALTHGRSGECYLLTGRYVRMVDLINRVRVAAGRRPLTRVMPTELLRPFAVMMEPLYQRRRRWPSLTRYAIYTLGSQVQYSHDKATVELDYHPRDPLLAVDDAVAFLLAGGFAGHQVWGGVGAKIIEASGSGTGEQRGQVAGGAA